MSIPEKIRKFENLHIVFWLFKDMSWCMEWKTLGICMIIPTISISIYTTLKMKYLKSELYHNIAVLFWIIANSYWMISEFIGIDEIILLNGVQGKHLALLPFLAGVIILAIYYGIIDKKLVNDASKTRSSID